jgi:hypothetical protein
VGQFVVAVVGQFLVAVDTERTCEMAFAPSTARARPSEGNRLTKPSRSGRVSLTDAPGALAWWSLRKLGAAWPVVLRVFREGDLAERPGG